MRIHECSHNGTRPFPECERCDSRELLANLAGGRGNHSFGNTVRCTLIHGEVWVSGAGLFVEPEGACPGIRQVAETRLERIREMVVIGKVERLVKLAQQMDGGRYPNWGEPVGLVHGRTLDRVVMAGKEDIDLDGIGWINLACLFRDHSSQLRGDSG